jgi:beta-fructofuranosidase
MTPIPVHLPKRISPMVAGHCHRNSLRSLGGTRGRTTDDWHRQTIGRFGTSMIGNSQGKSPFSLDCYLSWMSRVFSRLLSQQKDGLLAVNVPSTIDAAWNQPVDAQFTLQKGARLSGKDITIDATGSFGWAAAGAMPERCKIEAHLQFEPGTRRCGIMMRTSNDLESSYYVRLEPRNHRVVFDSWPRGSGPDHPTTSIDGGYMAGLDRWMTFAPGNPIELKVFVDRTIAVIYVDGQVALCARMYDLPTGRWGLFVEQGRAQFSNIKITTL